MKTFFRNLYWKLKLRGYNAAWERGLHRSCEEAARASDIYVRIENGFGIFICESQGKVFAVDGLRKEEAR